MDDKVNVPAKDIITTAAGTPLDPDEFLAWTTTLGSEYDGYKVELANGCVTAMMINVKRGHVEVCSNILRLLFASLDPDRYTTSSADFGVRVRKGVRYPDILVEPKNADKNGRASENPVFIAEILSPSTASVDFLQKLPEYTGIRGLQAYLICSQDEAIVWLTERGAGGEFPPLPKEIVGRGASVNIAALGIEMPMAEIYRGIPS